MSERNSPLLGMGLLPDGERGAKKVSAEDTDSVRSSLGVLWGWLLREEVARRL